MIAVLEIGMDNDAFVDQPEAELARILRELADKVESNGFHGRGGDLSLFFAYDKNGNRVGKLEVTR